MVDCVSFSVIPAVKMMLNKYAGGERGCSAQGEGVGGVVSGSCPVFGGTCL